MAAMKPRWLDRRIAAPGPYLALVFSQDEYLAMAKQANVKNPGEWLTSPTADATTNILHNEKGDLLCIVALNNWQRRCGVEIAGLLVHEAVHVWQEYCVKIGERLAGAEQQAYGIQAIAQELMAEFARRQVP